jgi:hypothetical protein
MKNQIIISTITTLRYSAGLLLLLLASYAGAQTMNSIKAEEAVVSPFEKNFRIGVSFNLYWTKLQGSDLPVSYFAKPSLGMNIRAEYYFNSFLGLGAGFGYQQRGTGVVNPDNSGGAFSHPWIVNKYGVQGDVDSTYLEKIRFNTLELPVTVLLRTPKEVIKGVRLSAAAGVIYMYNIEANDVFQSIVDGFHKDTPVTADYVRHDLGYQLSFGADIDAGGAGTIFQLHFVYNEGLKNVFAAGQGTGTQAAYGIRLACLF